MTKTGAVPEERKNAMPLISAFIKLIFMFLRVEDKNSFPPPLSAQEEMECFERMKKGDAKAREKLILHNLRLVAHIVKKYSANEKNQEDLISIGTIGLIKAIDSYDPSNGTRFATYAGKCLQNEILIHFRALKKSRCEVSINETIDVDKDGNPLTYMDVICTDDTIADDIFVKISGAKARRIINAVLGEREKEIITMRYGLDDSDPMTQREIAALLGISRSYVSRIEKSALCKIQDCMCTDMSHISE